MGRIDLGTGAVTFPYTGFNGPDGIAVAPSGDFALVANDGGGNVGRIDLTPDRPDTGAVTFPYTGFDHPLHVAIAPSGDFALVSNGGTPGDNNDLGRIDLGTGAVTFPYTGFTSTSPGGIAIAPSGPGSEDFALVARADGYCGEGSNCDVGRIDLVTGAVTFPYTGFNIPRGVAIAPGGDFALVSNNGGNNVARIDLVTGNVTFPYTGFDRPYGIAIDPSGDFALVGNGGGNNVGRIDLVTGAVTFPYTGFFSGPFGVAIVSLW